jgi:hypothetical protein
MATGKQATSARLANRLMTSQRVTFRRSSNLALPIRFREATRMPRLRLNVPQIAPLVALRSGATVSGLMSPATVICEGRPASGFPLDARFPINRVRVPWWQIPIA